MNQKPSPSVAPQDLDAVRLTRILHGFGVLERGKVVLVRKERLVTTPVSILTRLALQYDADAPAEVPASLICKEPRPAQGQAIARREIHFYRALSGRLPNPPIVRCYGSDPGSDTQPPWLLLEDLSASHMHRDCPLPASGPHLEQAVVALAALHAIPWQNDPLYTGMLADLPDERAFAGKLEMMTDRYRRFADHLGDALADSRRRVYERIFASGSGPWKRLLRREHLTLIHGDAHCGNVMVPRNGAATGVFLIDWQFWGVDIGVRDLAYMMALHWYPAQRNRFERHLLQHYHQRLLELGVADYSWDDLWTDYRQAVIRNLLVPSMLWERGVPAERWWPLLECTFLAYDDLGCAELLGK